MLMRLVALLLLLSVFSLAACSLGDKSPADQVSMGNITAVLLTDSERGDLKPVERSPDALVEFGMEQNPGYSKGSKSHLPSYFGLPPSESLYIADYGIKIEYVLSYYLSVITSVFKPENVDDALRASYALKYYAPHSVILTKNNTVTFIFGHAISSTLTKIPDDIRLPSPKNVAGNISQRFGMEIVEINRTPEFCVFNKLFSCVNYSVNDGSIELLLQNDAGGEIKIREITITAAPYYLKSSECGTGAIDKSLSNGPSRRFVLNKNTTSDGGECNYGKDWREKNLYHLAFDVTLNGTEFLYGGTLVASGS